MGTHNGSNGVLVLVQEEGEPKSSLIANETRKQKPSEEEVEESVKVEDIVFEYLEKKLPLLKKWREMNKPSEALAS